MMRLARAIAGLLCMAGTTAHADVRCMPNSIAPFKYCVEGYSAFDSAKITINFDAALAAHPVSQTPFVVFMVAALPITNEWNEDIALRRFLDVVTVGDTYPTVQNLKTSQQDVGPFTSTHMTLQLGNPSRRQSSSYVVDALQISDRIMFLITLTERSGLSLQGLAGHHANALATLEVVES